MDKKKEKKDSKFKLDFRVTVVLFVAVFLLLIFILFTNARKSIEDIFNNNTASQTSVLEPEANDKVNLSDVVPFVSDNFSVKYDEATSKYLIYVEPYSTMTKEDIEEWLLSFEDVENVNNDFFVYVSIEDRRPQPQP